MRGGAPAAAAAGDGVHADLFDTQPVTVTPRYVPFEFAPGVLFALWSGRRENPAADPARTFEVGLMVPGRTFVAADPDGNLIRVSPID